MTKSTITRERLEELAAGQSGFNLRIATLEESQELARMALAAMDSESGCLPLDYLQGHKDGLEWAAQLAEANHPETGDWLYDDPIELAKAIRKGPDMPPEQPAADSEPDRNPVLAYADSYRDMAKQGVESVPIWSVITDLERNIAPLYRHAQPAPVVPDEKPMPNPLSMHAVDAVAAIAEVKGWNACRAAMLKENPVCTCPSGDGSLRWPCPVHPGNSPVIPDGYVMVPKEMTDEIGEAIAMQANCCGGIALDIYDAMIAAAPHDTPALNSVQSVVTVPGKWIPVSERMPEDKPGCYEYLVFETINNRVAHDYWNVPDDGEFTPFWNHYGEHVTHWRPLPSAPQEVK